MIEAEKTSRQKVTCEHLRTGLRPYGKYARNDAGKACLRWSGFCGAGSVNRRLSLRWFEPNTCHYVKPQVSAGFRVSLAARTGAVRSTVG